MNSLRNAVILQAIWVIAARGAVAVEPAVAQQDVPRRESLLAKDVWPSFLSKHDMVFERAPKKWSQGLPLGNGLLGMMIWGSGDPLKFTLDRTDIWEQRHWDPPKDKYKWSWMKSMLAAGRAREVDRTLTRPGHSKRGRPVLFPPPPYPTRLPVGRMELEPVGQVQDVTMRLRLCDATAEILIQTDCGRIRLEAYAHATKPLLIIRMTTQQAESGAQWQIFPFNTPDAGFGQITTTLNAWGYPLPEEGRRGDVDYWSQAIPEGGGEYAVAWCERHDGPNTRTLTVSIGHTEDTLGGLDKAIAAVEHGSSLPFEPLHLSHRQWWADYYPASFLSIPETRLEGLYWIEMYKLASATRPNHLPLGFQGPFNLDGQMPWLSGDYHWNTDVQVSYYPIYTANRLEFGESLYDMVDRGRPNMRELCRTFFEREGEFIVHGTDHQMRPVYGWAGAQYEFCGGLWAAHLYWLHWRYSQDKTFLGERAFPLLKEVLRPILDELEADGQGVLHLPWSYSPEYAYHDNGYWGPDGTFDLTLIRFGCRSLLEACDVLGIADPEQERWRDTLKRLAPHPVDPHKGIMVRADAPYEIPHRHPSHLAPLFPFHQLTWEKDRKLLEPTLRQWTLMGSGEWVGWSWGLAAAIAAHVERPNLARSFLLDFADRFVSESTIYMQGTPEFAAFATRNDFQPTMEAGPSACMGLQNMLLQSHHGLIRVFPAVPPLWDDVSFWSLRTEGALLVSAVRRQGQTQFVHIESTVGGPCRVKTNFQVTEPVHVEGATGWKQEEDGTIAFDTKPGGHYFIWSGPERPHAKIAPVEDRPWEHHFYGTKTPPRL